MQSHGRDWTEPYYWAREKYVTAGLLALTRHGLRSNQVGLQAGELRWLLGSRSELRRAADPGSSASRPLEGNEAVWRLSGPGGAPAPEFGLGGFLVQSRAFSTLSLGLKVKVAQSDSLRPHGLYSPRNSPGLNTRVGSLSLFQGIFPTQGSNPGLPHCGRLLYHRAAREPRLARPQVGVGGLLIRFPGFPRFRARHGRGLRHLARAELGQQVPLCGGRAGWCLLRARGTATASLALPALSLPSRSCAAWTCVLMCRMPTHEFVEKRDEIARGRYTIQEVLLISPTCVCVENRESQFLDLREDGNKVKWGVLRKVECHRKGEAGL